MEFETKPIRRHFNSLGLMYFFGTLLIFGVQYAEVFLIERLPLTGIYDTDVWLLISTVPMYLISMPLMMLLIRRVPAVSVEKHPITFLQWLTAFFMCYAIMYLGNLVGLGLTFVIGMVKGSPVDNALVDIATDISPWTALVIMVLCAPVFEELIFRKLLIDRTVKYGEKIAVLFSGIFFGLFHGNLNQFAYAFILGVFWGFIYVKTGKILYTICMHMVVNFLGSVVSIFLIRSIAYEELMYASGSGDMEALMNVVSTHLPGLMLFGLYGLTVVGFVITGIVCLAVNYQKMKLLPAEIPVPKGKLFSAAFLNAGVILFAAFWIIQIILQLLQ
jgi:membrane protease YdiL (CAAX protease family)